jgi:excinuclease ABC subunit B
LQQAYNEEHAITPVTAKREVNTSIVNIQQAIARASAKKRVKDKPLDAAAKAKRIAHLEQEMLKAAENLDFERAIQARDELNHLKNSQ